jgi:translation initiation factor IF-3
LIDAEGNNLGTVPTYEALRLAEEAGLDLVEIAPNSTPPVCKLLDYGKYKYQLQIKLRPAIDDHDYDVKMRSMLSFFEEGDKVKITLRFRGREMAHQDIGVKVLERVREDTAKVAKVESEPRLEGRQMVMVLAPK